MKKVSNKGKVVAVVVTYNRKDLLHECIEALLHQDYDNCHILVVDNASTDGTEESIKKYLKIDKFKYYNTGENLGGAGGFNYGMKKAYELGCDFVWVMDDDCIVHTDSLTKLLDADKKLKGEYGFLSSKVLWKDDSICKMNIQKRTFGKWLKDFDTNYQKIAMASFVSLFLKSSIIEKYGLPIKDFFIWTDDWEYTRRISRDNKCYFISNSIVTHKSKDNEGANISTVDGDRISRFNYLYRNDCVLYRREGLKGKILFKLRIILHKLRVYKSDKIDKKERIKIINNAIKEGKKFYPEIEYVPTNKKRILYMYGECLSTGGQETFTLNVLNNINKDKINIDLFTPYVSKNDQIIEAVKNENGKIYAYNGKFENDKGNKYDFYKNTKKFLKEYSKKYEIVHINSGSTFALAIGARLAKKYGIKNVIVHSHSSGVPNKKHDFIIKLFSRLLLKNVDVYLACSKEAAIHKFPKRIINENKYTILYNGINLSEFSFNNKIREEYRKKLDINDSFVLCHVGRFCDEKNQIFIIDILKELIKTKQNTKLLLIGDGDTKDDIIKYCKKLNIEKNVIFLGNRNDVNKILQGSDVFVFPSKFEGFGLAVLEAQSEMLPVVCSDRIPNEVKINDTFCRLSLYEPIDNWINAIINFDNCDRTKRNDKKFKDYDIVSVCKKIEDIYLSRCIK